MTRKCLKKKETPSCLENLTLGKNILLPEFKYVSFYPTAVWLRSQMFLPLYQLPLFLAPAGDGAKWSFQEYDFTSLEVCHLSFEGKTQGVPTDLEKEWRKCDLARIMQKLVSVES